MTLEQRIEEQCDNMATGTQMREFLRDDEGNEPLLREMLRLNLEQFARTLAAAVRAEVIEECAKVADAEQAKQETYDIGGGATAYCEVAKLCAAAIRALKARP